MQPINPAEASRLRGRLLDWYDRHRRELPWRAPPGVRPEPYHVWLSEVMLQQTTVATVAPYFRAFLDRWPTVQDLAAADLDSVLTAWAGLGYYARARNLHRCARMVADEHGGRFPDEEAELRRLPGIGAYTAAAVAAIAFDRPALPIDGNVERVVARLFGIDEPLPGARPAIGEAAAALVGEVRPGDFAQAMMDLGATICMPRAPRCMLCPIAQDCRARAAGEPERLPVKVAKRARPLRIGTVWWAERPDGAVLLRRRPESWMLGGMMEVPSSGWYPGDACPDVEALSERWQPLPGVVRHGFTHFELELAVVRAQILAPPPGNCVWALPDRLGDHALPTLMRKVVRHTLAGGA